MKGGNPPYGGNPDGGNTGFIRDLNNNIKNECMAKTVNAALTSTKNIQNELTNIIKMFDTLCNPPGNRTGLLTSFQI